MAIELKSLDQLKSMRKAGLLVGETLQLLRETIKPGMTTSALDVVAAAKAKPDTLSYGSNGNGTAQHMIGTQFQMLTGTEILHVPYKGSAPLATDLLGGQVTMSFDTITPVLPFIKEKKLRPLAVTTAKRSSTLPGVPTMKESGIDGYAEAGSDLWMGVFAPRGTPRPVVDRLNGEIAKVLKSPDVADALNQHGMPPAPGTREELGKEIERETNYWGRVIRERKITGE